MKLELRKLGQTAERFLPPNEIPHMVRRIGNTDSYFLVLDIKRIAHTMEAMEWVVYDEFHHPIDVVSDEDIKMRFTVKQ